MVFQVKQGAMLARLAGWLAAPSTEIARKPLDVSRFELGVCPGCRTVRPVASLRCSLCDNEAAVRPDA